MPASTLPPSSSTEPLYPSKLSKELKLRLFSLDITDRHNITKGQFRRTISPFLEAGSPLAEWVNAFMTYTFRKLESMELGHEGDDVPLGLYDPICVWYALTADDVRWRPSSASPEDIRIETTGQWTRGACVVDRRNRRRIDSEVESSGDHGLWLSTRAGNRILRMDGSPGENEFGGILMERIFI
jgi:inosine-uridine nucleoside N-ribohydrolase